jgi:poly(ADP-ribose) glycohydrolase
MSGTNNTSAKHPKTLTDYWNKYSGTPKRKREDQDEPDDVSTMNHRPNPNRKQREKDNTFNAWNEGHVRLPCSKHNVFYSRNNRPLSKWYTIQTVLEQEISNSRDFEEAILTINPSWKHPNFNALHDFFACYVSTDEYKRFFEIILPQIQRLALELPSLCSEAIPLLRKQEEKSVSLTSQQVACLLAHALFCTYPRRNTIQDPDDEYFSYPSINFTTLFRSAYQSDFSCPPLTVEKLKCLLFGYFDQVTRADYEFANNIITFERRKIDMDREEVVEMWQSSTRKLINMNVRVHGSIEDDAPCTSQVDFANKIIGGGVLGRGCVQEEIRFLVNADCIVSRLFCEELDDNECILIRGSVRYSLYTGYGDTFEYRGVFNQEQIPHEEEIIAVDALNFRDPRSSLVVADQYKASCIIRELQKVYCGFSKPNMPDKPVATGNWGCGVFGGDKQLKSLIQLMAASEAGRNNVIYFAYGEEEFAHELSDLTLWLRGLDAQVGELYDALVSYRLELKRAKKTVSTLSLFQYVRSFFENIRGLIPEPAPVDNTAAPNTAEAPIDVDAEISESTKDTEKEMQVEEPRDTQVETDMKVEETNGVEEIKN